MTCYRKDGSGTGGAHLEAEFTCLQAGSQFIQYGRTETALRGGLAGTKLLNPLPWHYCFWELKMASLTCT